MKSKLVFLNQCFDKNRLRNLISWVLFTKGEKRTIETIEKLKDLGFNYATRAGISLSVDDLKIPSEKVALVSQAKQQMSLADREYEKGNVTSIEKLQQLVDTWHRTSETLKQTVISNFQATDKLSPVYMMAFSGARGNISQVRQLAGMRGLMADPQGQIIGFPIRSNFREGLTLTEYMISCYGARKGLVDTALRTADAGYLTRRLVDVSQHMVVTTSTCGTRKGIILSDLAISGKPALSLRDRLVGRVLAEDVYSTFSPTTIDRDSRKALVRRQDVTKVGKRNQEISATLASQIVANQKKVSVRSPLTCSIRHGVCQLCYGWSLSEGRLVNLGEAVGIIAAQSIGEPGTQLTMRTFHTGGVFSGDVMTEIRAPYEGTVHFRNPLQGLLIRTSHGKIAFLTKSGGELVLIRQNQRGSMVTPSMATDDHRTPNTVDRSKKATPNNPRQTTQNTFEDEIKTLFTLETSTIVFVRQHEKVSRTQLLAEYSSMGTEINETIEAKRTLFANNAGQISFTNLLYRSETQGNGNIIRTAQTLGSIWILSGKKPSPLMLLDILEKGTHIVNQSTIIARVPCPNVDLPVVSPLMSRKTKTTSIMPHLSLKVRSFESTEAQRLHSRSVDQVVGSGSPLQQSELALGLRVRRPPLKIERVAYEPLVIEGVKARILSKDGINFLPSILYSLILLINFDESRESSTNQYNITITNKETPFRSLDQVLGSGSPLQQSELPSVLYKNRKGVEIKPFIYPIFTKSVRGSLINSSPSKGKFFAPDKTSIQSVTLTDPTFYGLSIQPYVSNYPHTTKPAVRVQGQGSKINQKSFNKVNGLVKKGLSPHHTRMWVFSPFYKNVRNGIAWFDTRFLNKNLNLGEVIWFDKDRRSITGELVRPCKDYAALITRWEQRNQRHLFASINPRVGQPSSYIKTNCSPLFSCDLFPTIHFYTKGKECKVWNSITGSNNRDVFSCTQSSATLRKASNLFFKQGKTQNDKQSSSIRSVNTTKAWIVTFEKNQNATKKRAVRLQSDHFIVPSPAVKFTPLLTRSSMATPSMTRGSMAAPGHRRGSNRIPLPQSKRFSWKRYNSTKEQELKPSFIKLVQSSNKVWEGSLGSGTLPKPQVDNVAVSSCTENRSFSSMSFSQQTNRKHLSCWVYCPQQVKKFSTLHESIDLYRNRQVDNFTFDSSIVYFKAQCNLGLVYDYQKHLQLIASKLFLFLEGDTSQISTQTVQRAISGLRSKFPTPYLNTFTSTFQDTNRQYSSVYFGGIGTQEKKPSSLGVFHFARPQIDMDNKFCYLREKSPSSNLRKTKGLSSGFGKVIFRPQVNALKKNGLLSLRKWMQIPQSYAIQEPLVFLEKKRKNFSFPDSEKSTEPYKVCQQKIARFSDDQEIATSVIPMKSFSAPLKVEAPPEPILHSYIHSPREEGPNVNKDVKVVAIKPQTDLSVFYKNGKAVKKLAFCELRKRAELVFDTRNCFHSNFFDKNRGVCQLLLRSLDKVQSKIALDKVQSKIALDKVQSKIALDKVFGSGVRRPPLRLPGVANEPLQFSVFDKNGKGAAIEPRASKEVIVDRAFYLQENGQTERYKRLVWKNLINCRSFMLLRTCQLQVQIISNSKARHLLPLPANHPLTWHSLVSSSNVRKIWHKKENSTNLSLVSLVGTQDFAQSVNSQARQKACFYQLNLRQQITVGPLPLGADRTQSFFDFISYLESKTNSTLQIAKPQLGVSTLLQAEPLDDVNKSSITSEVKVRWPYSSQAKILPLISKGLSVPLPSKRALTGSYSEGSGLLPKPQTTKFSICIPSKKEIKRLGFGRGKGPQRGIGLAEMKESAAFISDKKIHPPVSVIRPIFYTFQFRFVTKVKTSVLMAKYKPNKFLFLPLLPTKNFTTRVVSANSYLLRFLGILQLAKVDLHKVLGSRKGNRLEKIVSPVMGEMISQDTTQLKGSFSHSPIEGDFFTFSQRKTVDRVSGKLKTKISSKHFAGNVNQMNTLLLTKEDQISMSLSGQKTNIFVSQFLTLGEEFIPNYAALASGEVVAIERNKITFRRSQGSLFYPNGVIHVTEGQWVNKNAPILTLTYQKLVTGDIVQGIPKIEQFFEAPATRDGEPFPNSLQSILRNTYQQLKSGIVTPSMARDNHRTPDPKKNLLPHSQAVKQSMSEIQQILVEGILRVYLSQGVRIADKHLEVVIRQMTSKGQILHVGNTGLFQGEFVNLDRIERINLGTYGQKADYEPSVLGITQASLGSDSFISAASFQETTRVLSRDTIIGKTDFLRGLKERVVLGDVIQAGTGLDDNINYGLKVTST